MKKFLALILVLSLICCTLVACDTPQSLIEKANAALQNEPYQMTMKMEFSSDNKDLNEIFSIMNMEVPVTVDGKNIAMDMSMDIMGTSAGVEVIVADMMMYYNIEVMGQQVKMKATMNEEQYKEFMAENNTEMMVNPEDFGELTVEKKDGKKYIACAKISNEALEELNEMMEEALDAVDGKAAVKEVSYGVMLADGKYETMDMTCVYTVTAGGETYTVTFKLGAAFTYDSVAKITAPADADQYQRVDFGQLMD